MANILHVSHAWRKSGTRQEDPNADEFIEGTNRNQDDRNHEQERTKHKTVIKRTRLRPGQTQWFKNMGSHWGSMSCLI